MTPQEKSEELINNLYEIHCKVFKADTTEERATRYKLLHPICIESAILAVDELIQDNYNNENIVNGGLNSEYWKNVKQEIEKNKH